MKVATTLIPLDRKDVLLAAHMAPPNILAKLQFPYCYGLISVDMKTHLPCALLIYSAARGDHLDIEWLYVYEDYRGEGLGEELMDAAFQLGKSSGLSYVCVRLEGELNTKKNADLVRDYLMNYGFDAGMPEKGDWELTFSDFEASPFYRRVGDNPDAKTCAAFGERETRQYLKQNYEKLKDAPFYDFNKALAVYDPELSIVVVKNGEVKGILLTTARDGILFPLLLEYGGDTDVLNQLVWTLYYDADEYRIKANLKQEDMRLRVLYSERASAFFKEWFPKLSAQPVTVFMASSSVTEEEEDPTETDLFGSSAPETYRWLKNEYYGDVI